MARMEGTAGRHSAVVLKDRQQVTTTGRISHPAVSPDGSCRAYVSTKCGAGTCAYGLEVQEVGSRATRSIVEGTRGIDYIAWSQDRDTVVAGTLTLGTTGSMSFQHWVVPGASRRYFAAFFAGGDSLLLAPSTGSDTAVWVAGLDAIPRDSIRVRRELGISFALNVRYTLVHHPGSPARRSADPVIDRSGRGGPQGLSIDGPESCVERRGVVHQQLQPGAASVDSATGRFGASMDTLWGALHQL
jgi:hypothetical protein